MKKTILLNTILGLAVTTAFWACGDSSDNSASANSQISAETLEDLPNCSKTREGETAVILDDSTYYRCLDGRWEKEDAPIPSVSTLDDLPNCTQNRESEKAFVAEEDELFVCSDGRWELYDKPVSSSSTKSTNSSDSQKDNSKSSSSSSIVSGKNSSSSSVTLPVSSGDTALSSSSVATSSSSVSILLLSSMAQSSSSLFIPSSSYTFVFDGFWLGSEGSERINIDTYDGNDARTSYWFAFNDNGEGGKSKVIGPDGSLYEGNLYYYVYDRDTYVSSSVIRKCNGVCGTAVFDKGGMEYSSDVGFGFDIDGEISKEKGPVAVDINAWGGFCIVYASEVDARLELGLGGNADAEIHLANPAASLPKSKSAITKHFTWSQFKQPGWYTPAWNEKRITGYDVADRIVSIMFKAQADSGQYKFNICAIGPYGTCELVRQNLQPYEIGNRAKSIDCSLDW